jgi:tRNA threonylcarbamoyladenosine biosynthesis protein TsaB
MLVLALDTTTRAGSLALARDDQLLEAWSGDPNHTHASRLPGDILDMLQRHGLGLADVDLYGVAAGPGSFTGLRIGIATIQGLAFAHGRKVVGVSALEALAWSAREPAGSTSLVAAWMDARRGEVFASLGTPEEHTALAGPEVASPGDVLGRWETLVGNRPVVWMGDGALAYRSLIEQNARERAWTVLPEVPLLAGAIAAITRRRAAEGRATPPHGVRPLYVRRPDAELARDRRRAATAASDANPREDGR